MHRYFVAVMALLVCQALLTPQVFVSQARANQTSGNQAIANQALPQDRLFDVFFGDKEIGRHEIRFSCVGDELHVAIAIELEVKFAFLTVFSYSHSNMEIWKDGKLQAIETRTDDDGESHWVRGRATTTGFRVESSSGTLTAPQDIIPTSYWRYDTLDQALLLDTQHGTLAKIASLDGERDPNFPQEVYRHALRGDLDLDLWYDRERALTKIAFEARGAEIYYQLQSNGGVQKASLQEESHACKA